MQANDLPVRLASLQQLFCSSYSVRSYFFSSSYSRRNWKAWATRKESVVPHSSAWTEPKIGVPDAGLAGRGP
ncbi:hypothetical protein EJB05_46233, partial [Eragrostis curvula]